MREKKYHIYLTDDEQSRVIQSLMWARCIRPAMLHGSALWF